MKDIIKNFNDFNLRIFDHNNVQWFMVVDVCKILGLTNPTEAIRNIDNDDLSTTEVIDKIGRKQKANIINEYGLYELIFKSRKKEAQNFKKWITHEVIPSIRKTGKYSIPQSLKKISTENRKLLTEAWENGGITKKHHFIQLTLQEYKALGFDKDKRKKDLDKEEVLTLAALESMEALKLFHDPKNDYYKCKDSLYDTAKQVEFLKNKQIKG